VQMGIAGNVDPAFVEATVVGYPQGATGGGRAAAAAANPLADLDYVIGSAALSPAYAVSYPMKQGLITDWDSMEKLWTACLYK
jgi:actin-related protein 3